MTFTNDAIEINRIDSHTSAVERVASHTSTVERVASHTSAVERVSSHTSTVERVAVIKGTQWICQCWYIVHHT